jgi:hypothetical protein
MDWHTFELGGTVVRVLAPEGAEFVEQDGLSDGTRSVTWSPRDEGFFGVAAGSSAGFTADGLLARPDVRVESDWTTGLAGVPGRRVAFRIARHLPRRREEGGVSAPERTWTELGDLLFVEGDGVHLRVGYRVDERDGELRETFARMLDRVEVRRDG